jgi:hypothetical protein
MRDDLGERPHFQLPIRALDAHDLAGLLRALDELAQVLMRMIVGVEALRLGFIQQVVTSLW